MNYFKVVAKYYTMLFEPKFGFAAIAGVIGIAGSVIGGIEARKARKAAETKANEAAAEAKRIRENTRVEEAGAKFQAGAQTDRAMSSADDFLNPLRIG